MRKSIEYTKSVMLARFDDYEKDADSEDQKYAEHLKEQKAKLEKAETFEELYEVAEALGYDELTFQVVK